MICHSSVSTLPWPIKSCKMKSSPAPPTLISGSFYPVLYSVVTLVFCFVLFLFFFSFLLKELFPSGNFCPLISHAWRKPFFLVSHWASCQVSIQISQFVWNLPLVCTSTGANTHWPIQHSLEPYLISKNNSIAPNTLCIGYSVITYT